MINVEVTITRADIDADGHCGTNCPLWRALLRVLPGAPDVEVGRMFLTCRSTGCRMDVPLPREARLWIARYDFADRADPVTFTVRVPDDWAREVST